MTAPDQLPPKAPHHSLPVRVYYEDTDAGGIVYHANYLRFAERARTEMLRDLADVPYQAMRHSGLAFAVRQCTADYLRPARLDDLVTVESRLREIGAATVDVMQQVTRDGTTLVMLALRLACLGPDGRPRRIPTDLRTAMAGLI